MSGERKTAIVTGGSQGIGAGLVKAFLERGYNVVANSRKITKSGAFEASDEIALVDGNIAEPATAARIVETALSRFKSIDALVNNAGIFFTKPFTDYTVEDFKALVSTNVEGFLYVTQLSIRQMLAQKSGGSIVTITAALARNPIRGVTAAGPMITKGGLETITQHLAMEYAKDGIRVNAGAPGAVYTPPHQNTPQEGMESLSPMGRPSTVRRVRPRRSDRQPSLPEWDARHIGPHGHRHGNRRQRPRREHWPESSAHRRAQRAGAGEEAVRFAGSRDSRRAARRVRRRHARVSRSREGRRCGVGVAPRCPWRRNCLFAPRHWSREPSARLAGGIGSHLGSE